MGKLVLQGIQILFSLIAIYQLILVFGYFKTLREENDKLAKGIYPFSVPKAIHRGARSVKFCVASIVIVVIAYVIERMM